MSVWMLPEEIIIWICMLGKEDPPSFMWVGIVQSINDANRIKMWKKDIPSLSLSFSWDIHLLLPLDVGDPGFWAFGFQDLHQCYPTPPFLIQTMSYTSLQTMGLSELY
jgi:hypothetical protein